MKKTEKLILNNSFHRATVTLRIPIDDAKIDGKTAEITVSHGQFQKAKKSLCGRWGCRCGCWYNNEPHFWGDAELRYVELRTSKPFDYKAYTA